MRLPVSAFVRRCRGHTRFELLVRVLVVGILASVLLERMLYYQEQAERTVMETTIIHIRSGIRLQVADLMIQQRTSEIGAILQENPVRWLDHPPDGYLGVLGTTQAGRIPKGSWYFDSTRGELVYVPRLARFFTDTQGKREVRFKVRARAIGSELSNGQPRRIEGVEIVPVQPYKWF
jgi:general secretion pathway protein G